jgi:riboflavin kinase/FMN adenylyltransferase
VLPRDGVYAGRAQAGGSWYAAGINLGPNPTFADQERKLEAHLIDYSGDLYGARIAVEFIDRLRDTVRFDSVEKLKAQLAIDIERARALAKGGVSR